MNTILLVDDDLSAQNAFTRALTTRGWAVTTATTAEEARRLVESGARYDAVLGAASALEAWEWLREHAPEQADRLVVMTSPESAAVPRGLLSCAKTECATALRLVAELTRIH